MTYKCFQLASFLGYNFACNCPGRLSEFLIPPVMDLSLRRNFEIQQRCDNHLEVIFYRPGQSQRLYIQSKDLLIGWKRF
jgi:hypothetical protein